MKQRYFAGTQKVALQIFALIVFLALASGCSVVPINDGAMSYPHSTTQKTEQSNILQG